MSLCWFSYFPQICHLTVISKTFPIFFCYRVHTSEKGKVSIINALFFSSLNMARNKAIFYQFWQPGGDLRAVFAIHLHAGRRFYSVQIRLSLFTCLAALFLLLFTASLKIQPVQDIQILDSLFIAHILTRFCGFYFFLLLGENR